MIAFLDLPLELLPHIIQYLVRPSHLAQICLVNRAFYTFTVPHLYARAFVYAWHKEGKAKVVKLFRSLSEYPHLARHVVKLEIRDFPKALHSDEYEDIVSICLRGIANCTNLRACTWTRDGSLTTETLEVLLQCPALRELEINGHHEGHYDPRVLVRFSRLSRISLIMPSAAVIKILPAWTRAASESLRHLSLICKSSSFVNDELLSDLAPNLQNLENLYIVGCPKVTHRGLLVILAKNTRGLCALGLEGISPAFNMSLFSEQVTKLDALCHLHSITLTVHTAHAPTSGPPPQASQTTASISSAQSSWETSVLSLLSRAPLEQFHISTVGGEIGPALSEVFCTRVVDAHGARLRRFSVHRMRMSMRSIADICRRCVRLEQLFVVVEQDKLDLLGSALAQSQTLRAVHVNRPLDLGSEDVPIVARERILAIVKQCGPSLVQFGYNTRVMQVERVVIREEDGSLGVDVRLGPYESPEVPEQFLVVRT